MEYSQFSDGIIAGRPLSDRCLGDRICFGRASRRWGWFWSGVSEVGLVLAGCLGWGAC